MASIIQKKRLLNELKLLEKEPLHYCTAYPDESNQLVWYFLVKGQKNTDYHTGQEDGGGEYIGKIVHSPKYPIEPPDYYMLTPSGRYNVGSKICLSNSSYHKGEWSSTWNIKSILIAFYSIWLDDKESGISHIKDTPDNRKKMAMDSISYNLKNNALIYSKFDKTHLKDDDPIIPKKVLSESENNTEQTNTKLDNTESKNNELNDNELNNTKLDNTELDNTELDYTELDNTELDNTELDNTELNDTEPTNTELDNTELDNTELELIPPIQKKKIKNILVDNDIDTGKEKKQKNIGQKVKKIKTTKKFEKVIGEKVIDEKEIDEKEIGEKVIGEKVIREKVIDEKVVGEKKKVRKTTKK
jgi:ubiquitin-conjugating enzyme E2 J2